ncbi:MAG: hypothetical protein IH921_04565 [Gemmatimonadetes bacterium]|nr:hypothetical protein [Gemmatimonadota bacterium]
MSEIGMSPRNAVAAAVVMALVVYVPSLGNGFALDDTGDIVENTTVHTLANTGDILTSPYRGRVPPGRSPYRPVTSLTYALNWTMGSGSPVPFHAFNVALHGANTALVTILLTTLGATPILALLGGAVFAVHPVHVEAVANSVGRGDALMALFVLLGALAYLGRFRSAWARVGLVSLAYAMALASKENGVVLPALLVMLSLLFPERVGRAGRSERAGRTGGAERWDSQLPLFAALAGVLVLYLTVRYQVLGTLFHRDAAPYIVMLPTSLRMTTAVANVTELVRLLLFPADLVADYGPAVILPAGIGALRFWVGGGVLLGVAALAVRTLARRGRGLAEEPPTASSLRRSPWVTLGVVWVVLSLAVVGNVLFPVGVWVAERTLYLPTVGVSLLVVGLGQYAIGFLDESRPRLRWSFVGAATLLVLLGGARTWTRNAAWRDTEAVFLTLADEHPESFRAQWWMGMQMIEAGERDRGLEWLGRAVDLNPNELRLQLDFVRGLLLVGRPEEAMALVSSLPPADPARYVYLTQSHIQLDQPDRAREAVQEGLARFPQDARLMRQARELEIRPTENTSAENP